MARTRLRAGSRPPIIRIDIDDNHACYSNDRKRSSAGEGCCSPTLHWRNLTMLRLRDIMTREVFSMSPHFTIREAMEFLARKRVSGTPVLENGSVVGIVSASDLIAFAAALPGSPSERAYAESDWTQDDDASRWANDREAEGLVHGGLADGGDDVDTHFRETEGGLDDHTVAEVMTHSVHGLESTTEVSVAAQFMRNARIHRVLAMDAGKLCGIVSMSDIAGAVADQRVQKRFSHST